VPLVRLALPDRPEPLDLRGPQERRASPVLLERRAPKAHWVLRAHRALLDPPVPPGRQVRLVPQALLVLRERRGLLARTERLVPLDLREQRGPRVPRARRALRGRRASPVLRVHRGRRAFRVRRATSAPRVLLARLGLLEPRDRLGLRAFRVSKV
jgi:hypothetical protein